MDSRAWSTDTALRSSQAASELFQPLWHKPPLYASHGSTLLECYRPLTQAQISLSSAVPGLDQFRRLVTSEPAIADCRGPI